MYAQGTKSVARPGYQVAAAVRTLPRSACTLGRVHGAFVLQCDRVTDPRESAQHEQAADRIQPVMDLRASIRCARADRGAFRVICPHRSAHPQHDE